MTIHSQFDPTTATANATQRLAELQTPSSNDAIGAVIGVEGTGQEVIIITKNDNKELELDVENPTSSDAAAGVDAFTDSKPKRGFLTVKNAAYGCGILCFVGAIGIAAGVGRAGTANQANLQSVKMARISRSTSGKSGKGQAGLSECVIAPVTFVLSGDFCAYAPDEPPTKKEFDRYVWKPYMKECGGFWSDVFYIVTRFLLWLCSRLPMSPMQMMETQMTEVPTMKIPSACSDMMPSTDESTDMTKFMSSIFTNEKNTRAYMGLVEGCVNEVIQMDQSSLISGLSSTMLNVGDRRKLLAPDDLLNEE